MYNQQQQFQNSGYSQYQGSQKQFQPTGNVQSFYGQSQQSQQYGSYPATESFHTANYRGNQLGHDQAKRSDSFTPSGQFGFGTQSGFQNAASNYGTTQYAGTATGQTGMSGGYGARSSSTASYSQRTSGFGQPTSSYSQSWSSQHQPATSGSQSWSSYSQPATSAGQSWSSFNQPSTTYSQTASTYHQPTASAGQSWSSFAQPTASYSQTTSTYHQPTASSGQSWSSYSQPASSFGQTSSSHNQPASSASQSWSSYGQPTVASFGPTASSYGQSFAPSTESFHTANYRGNQPGHDQNQRSDSFTPAQQSFGGQSGIQAGVAQSSNASQQYGFTSAY